MDTTNDSEQALNILAFLNRKAWEQGEAEWGGYTVEIISGVLRYRAVDLEITAEDALSGIEHQIAWYREHPPYRFYNPNPVTRPMNLASIWRRATGYNGKGGLVVMHQGQILGWVNDLQHLECWQPGTLAVDEDGRTWKAIKDDGQAWAWQATNHQEEA